MCRSRREAGTILMVAFFARRRARQDLDRSDLGVFERLLDPSIKGGVLSAKINNRSEKPVLKPALEPQPALLLSQER